MRGSTHNHAAENLVKCKVQAMEIKPDDLSDKRVVALLEEHIDDMYRDSPPESVHTLDLSALRSSDVSFCVLWQN